MIYEYNLQAKAAAWNMETFGEEVFTSKEERALRILEEALELAQASGVPTHMVNRLVEHVYTKPAGGPVTEIADVFFCTLVAAASWGVDLGQLGYEANNKARLLRDTIRQKWKIKCEKGLTAFPDFKAALKG